MRGIEARQTKPNVNQKPHKDNATAKSMVTATRPQSPPVSLCSQNTLLTQSETGWYSPFSESSRTRSCPDATSIVAAAYQSNPDSHSEKSVRERALSTPNKAVEASKSPPAWLIPHIQASHSNFRPSDNQQHYACNNEHLTTQTGDAESARLDSHSGQDNALMHVDDTIGAQDIVYGNSFRASSYSCGDAKGVASTGTRVNPVTTLRVVQSTVAGQVVLTKNPHYEACSTNDEHLPPAVPNTPRPSAVKDKLASLASEATRKAQSSSLVQQQQLRLCATDACKRETKNVSKKKKWYKPALKMFRTNRAKQSKVHDNFASG